MKARFPAGVARMTAALWLALAVGAALAAGWAAAGESRPLDRVKIAVDEKVLTEREVAEIRNVRESELRSRLKGEELQKQIEFMERTLYDQLIEELLLEVHAERLKIEVSDKELEDRVDKILRRDPNMERLYTEEQLKSFLVKDLLRRQVIRREIDAKIYISDADVVAACRRRAGQAREVEVGHILIRDGEPNVIQRLESLREQLVQGSNFEKLALENSQDPSVQQNKGRLGFIGRGQFVKPFEEAAFAMSVGEISKPVQTRLGFHLIKVFSERIKSGMDCDNLDDVNRQSLRNQLLNTERDARLDTFLKKLREQASIRVVE